MFFVSDSRAANQLKQLGQIQSRGGPLTVLVKPSPPPKGDRQDGGGRFDSAQRGGMRGLASRDGDEVMEEDPTEVVRVRVDVLLELCIVKSWGLTNKFFSKGRISVIIESVGIASHSTVFALQNITQ